MKDNEIIKALECLTGAKTHCSICARETLDLINRQKAEIERLRKHNFCAARKHYNDGVKDFAKYLSSYPLYPVDLGDNRLVLEPQEVDYIVQKLTGGAE